ncbi:MAG: tRNA modification GTPase [Gemmataceae bacterium]
MTDPQDTIVALSSAPGPGARAIVRLSGPNAVDVARRVFHSDTSLAPNERAFYCGEIRLPDLHSAIPAQIYVWPQPRSYTGQNLVELHLPSSPPLVDLLISHLLNVGARAAQPGEFTLRAFLAGKLDLTRAEAVRAVIDAGSRDELQEALTQLAGGVSQPLQLLREDLLSLLADVEAGLDFTEENIQFINQQALLGRVSKGMALVTLLRKQFDSRGLAGSAFRVALTGRPNAGKSSLFNALAGRAAALVSSEPGTTRDYLVHRLDLGGVQVEIVDTAGYRKVNGSVESQAQALRHEQAEKADLLLLCVEAGSQLGAAEAALLRKRPATVIVATKCDLASAPSGQLATSSVTRAGLDALRNLIAERGRAMARPALAPSLSRCRHHVEACLEHLRRAHELVLFEEAPELVALELRSALDDLGAMVGAVYTDDLLDRIFSRFCIGK